jgi:hypothetical protein
LPVLRRYATRIRTVEKRNEIRSNYVVCRRYGDVWQGGVGAAAFCGRCEWINQCVQDNKGGASDAVIRKYCMCMNEKMGNNETRSIIEWEKANPAARQACDRASGWR